MQPKLLLVVSLTISIFLLTGPARVASQVKWEETFDSVDPPAGWRIFNNDGSPGTVDIPGIFSYVAAVDFLDDNGNVDVTVDPESGQSFWFSNFENANANGLLDEWLVSPRIQAIQAGDVLSFYAGAPDAGNGFDDSLRVFISTTDSSLASFVTEIGNFKVDGPIATWTEYTFDLSAFDGQDIFIGVNYYIVDCGVGGQHADAIWIDHFKITSNVTSVERNPAQVHSFRLNQNYPNPFNPTTNITFELARDSEVTLKVHNLLGQIVATLYDAKRLPAGAHTTTLDASGLPTGLYYYRLKAGEFSDIKRMTLIK